VIVDPETGDAVKDHTQHAIWLGGVSGRVGVAKGSSIAAVLITSAHATSGPGCRAARRSPKAPYVQRVPVDHSPDRQKRFQLREREHRGSRTVE
jgi:hypothetical protein